MVLALWVVSSSGRAASTQTFINTEAITIVDNNSATPFPSIVNVSGVAPATATHVRVQLFGLSHTYESDIDMLLVGPQGQRAILMSDAGTNNAVSGINVSFAANAASPIPITAAISGSTYRPVNYANLPADNFPFVASTSLDFAPADLSTFHLADPNGVWSLYVVDDANNDSGSIAGGWGLVFTVPAEFTVNSTADPGDGTCNATECTLREAVAAAGNGDLVRFSTLFDGSRTITLAAGEILVNKDLAIQGPGADRLTLSGNAASRIFRVGSGNTLMVAGATLRDGRAGDVGGAIVSDGNLFLRDCEVAYNSAGAGFSGGGLYIAGGVGVITGSSIHDNRASNGAGIEVINASALIQRSTIVGNVASTNGGGLHLSSIAGGSAKELEVRQSTIAHNRAASGGGIHVQSNSGVGASLSMRGVLLAGNSGNNIGSGGTGVAGESLGYNLSSDGGAGLLVQVSDQVDTEPRLGPLSLNGGTTSSLALLGGSPALDRGHSSGDLRDQRGIVRLFDIAGLAAASGGDHADIGAVEMRVRAFVSNSNNSGAGSLREAINLANGSGTGVEDILFDASFFNVERSIDLISALPEIFCSIALHGPGAHLLTVRRSPAASSSFRVFRIPGNSTPAAFSGLTIANGLADQVAVPEGVFGGGILSRSTLALSAVHFNGNRASSGGGSVALLYRSGIVDGCSFTGNSAAVGGGLLFGGSGSQVLTVMNSTFSGNQVDAGGYGSALSNFGQVGLARLQLSNSTIVNNSGGNGGLAVVSELAGGTAVTTMSNTIVAANTPANFYAEANTGPVSVVSTGYNLSNNYDNLVVPLATDLLTAPALAPLALNGGNVPTHQPLDNSPVLDAGRSLGSNRDQRGYGFRRPIDLPGISNPVAPADTADIGAVELQAVDRVFANGFE